MNCLSSVPPGNIRIGRSHKSGFDFTVFSFSQSNMGRKNTHVLKRKYVGCSLAHDPISWAEKLASWGQSARSFRDGAIKECQFPVIVTAFTDQFARSATILLKNKLCHKKTSHLTNAKYILLIFSESRSYTSNFCILVSLLQEVVPFVVRVC